MTAQGSPCGTGDNKRSKPIILAPQTSPILCLKCIILWSPLALQSRRCLGNVLRPQSRFELSYVACEIGSFSDFGPIVGLDVASGHAQDYYVLRLDLGCDRCIPADSELVIWQFDTALDIAVEIQVPVAEYFASDSYTTVDKGRQGPRTRGLAGRQVDALLFPQDLPFWTPGSRSLHQFGKRLASSLLVSRYSCARRPTHLTHERCRTGWFFSPRG